MTKNAPSNLKLHIEETGPERRGSEGFPSLDLLCRRFEAATGWPLRYAPAGSGGRAAIWSAEVDLGPGTPPGRLAIEGPSKPSSLGLAAAPGRIELAKAQQFATTVSELLSELGRTRRAVWQREAELAAGVPICRRPDDRLHLAARLEAVLKGGAEGVGCQAAALYLLDDATSQLKLRACWGLPKERFLEPARPLRGAVADLEALVGQAVVLQDARVLPHWKAPENYASAVCVPLSNSTTPLGTLWMFCNRPRDFTAKQTNLIEIIAGRLAADLEREMLWQEAGVAKQLDRQLEYAAQRQISRLPRISPLLDNWRLAGWTSQAQGIGGDFYDWEVLADGALSVSVGDALGEMFEAALTAATLHAALKSHACYRHNAQQMLARLNESLWCGSAGDQFASLFYALIEPETGAVQYSIAGDLHAAIVRESGKETMVDDTSPLGCDPETEYKLRRQKMGPGDVLVVFSKGLNEIGSGAEGRVADQAIAQTLSARRDASADDLIDVVRALTLCSDRLTDDCTLLVVQRR